MVNYHFTLTFFQGSCYDFSEILDHSKHDATTLYIVNFDSLSSLRNKWKLNDRYLKCPLWNIKFVEMENY